MAPMRKRPRDPAQLAKFVVDVATGDGHNAYPNAVGNVFGDTKIDYGQLVKYYGTPKEGAPGSAERRYSPAICTGAKAVAVFGSPERKHVFDQLCRAAKI